MKVKNKVLLAVTTALLGCSAPVAAKDNPYVKQYCSGVSDIAALVMIQRQSGVPIKEVMKSDSEYNTKEDKEVAKLVEGDMANGEQIRSGNCLLGNKACLSGDD